MLRVRRPTLSGSPFAPSHDADDAGIAAQPPGRLRRDGGAVLDFAAPGPAVGEHIGLDMNHDLVAVGCERRRIS